MKTITAYHFTGTTLRDGRPIPRIGEWLIHAGPVVPCESGLHASVHPFDALRYAPGNLLHRVDLRGDLVEHGGDKWVGRERRILASIDAEKLLREFARWNAMKVLHLWDAPEIVRRYIETGDETIRAAARDAARDAARAAAWAVARDVAWAATWDAAWAVAWDAASDAAWAAARDAARDAARAAAWAAAWDAARAAAWAAARQKFIEMVELAFADKENSNV